LSFFVIGLSDGYDFLESEVFSCVVAADALDDFLKRFVIVRIFSAVYPSADQVTQNAAEIFMARIGNETARVGQHPDKGAECAKVSECNKMLGHAVDAVVKPPS